MAASGVCAVNEVSEVPSLEFAQFMHFKVTEMQMLQLNVFFADYFLSTNACFM